jgi:hypothetical protein
LDAKIAVITGTVFAGVLVAGALAAPRPGNDAEGDVAGTLTADDPALLAALDSFESQPATVWYDEDEDYEDDDDDHDRHEDDHEDDHDDDHDDDDEDDD